MSEYESTHGNVRISHDVVASVAGLAAIETEGVHAMSEGISEGWAKKLSGKNIQRGVAVHIEEEWTSVELRIIVKHGENIQKICRSLQSNVKEAVENMTGLQVKEVNVRVDGVSVQS